MIQRIIEVPLEELQSEKAKDLDITLDFCCVICGKKLKENQKYKHIQLLENGNIISSSEDFENSQGFFPVGNECVKKLKINFSF